MICDQLSDADTDVTGDDAAAHQEEVEMPFVLFTEICDIGNINVLNSRRSLQQRLNNRKNTLLPRPHEVPDRW